MKQTTSPRRTVSARHSASPLPSTGPCSGSRSASWRTLAPARSASAAVPSLEAASTTTTSSITPPSRRSIIAPTIGSIVAAQSRVGTHTEIVAVRSSRTRSAGNEEWCSERTPHVGIGMLEAHGTRRSRIRARLPPSAGRSPAARTMDPMAVTREIAPWDQLLAAGEADGRLVARALEHARPAATTPLPQDLHADLLAGLERAGVQTLYAHQAQALEAAAAGPFVVTTGTAS